MTKLEISVGILATVLCFSVRAQTTLFNMAGSLWHLVDSVWFDRNPDENNRSPLFDSYRDGLLKACPDLALFRDIADAGKHRGLNRGVVKLKATKPTLTPGRNVLLLEVDGREVKFILETNEGPPQAVNVVLREVIDFWLRELATKNLPPPYKVPPPTDAPGSIPPGHALSRMVPGD